MYPTCHAPHYQQFRELLDYAHHRNLARLLTNHWKDGLLIEGALKEVRIGPPLEAIIVTYFWQGELWILGGYWQRLGEPTAFFQKMIEGYVAAIRQGEEPA